MLTVQMEAASSPETLPNFTRLHGNYPALQSNHTIRSNHRNSTNLLDLAPYLQRPQTLFGVQEIHHFQLRLLHGYLFSSPSLYTIAGPTRRQTCVFLTRRISMFRYLALWFESVKMMPTMVSCQPSDDNCTECL
jgi:hypothetical protein